MALNETRNFLTEAFKLAKRRSKERMGLLVAGPGRCGVQRLCYSAPREMPTSDTQAGSKRSWCFFLQNVNALQLVWYILVGRNS